MPIAPAPLFVDPIYNGAADPMIIRNEQSGKYYMFYTQRRASTAFEDSVAYCYGSAIGVAEADERGAYWYYRGALDLEFEFGHNTFWAPEVIWDTRTALYHMYVTYIRGIHRDWKGDACIMHYTSPDLLHWTHIGPLSMGSSRIIDPCLYPLPGGGYRMWYKDERSNSETHYAGSADLYNWTRRGAATTGHGQEGPNVFELGGRYWMIADEWHGLAVYHSDDLEHFTRQDGPMLLEQPGMRHLDGPVGRHADVIVCKGRAYIVYFVHYNDDGAREAAVGHAPTVVQMAELTIKDGLLICDRNRPLDIELD